MASNKPVLHADDHRPGGPDPLDAIFFDTYNSGGFLDVTTSSYTSFTNNGDFGITLTDNGAVGVALVSNAQMNIVNVGGSGGVTIQQLSGSGGISLTDGSSGGMSLTATTTMSLESADGMTLTDSAGGIKLYGTGDPSAFSGQIAAVTSNSVEVLAGDGTDQGVIILGATDDAANVGVLWVGQVFFSGSGLTFRGSVATVGSGQKFAVVDQGGHPIFEARNDGSVHIKTSHSIVADL